MPVFCPYCGQQNDDQTGQCKTCNSPLPRVTTGHSQTSNTHPVWQIQTGTSAIGNTKSLQGMTLFHIKWDFTLSGVALLYDMQYKLIAKVEVQLTNRSPAYVLKDLANQEVLRLQQTDFTKFMIAMGDTMLGQIEEHLVAENVDYNMQNARNMTSDLGKWVKWRTLNTKDEDETVARISEIDVENVPQGFDVRHCLTVKISDTNQNIALILAFVLYNLLRYR